jgi:hypothetical protein
MLAEIGVATSMVTVVSGVEHRCVVVGAQPPIGDTARGQGEQDGRKENVQWLHLVQAVVPHGETRQALRCQHISEHASDMVAQLTQQQSQADSLMR